MGPPHITSCYSTMGGAICLAGYSRTCFAAFVAAFEQAAKSLKMPLKIVRDTVAGGREGYEARMILVRPDQYVVWTADAAPNDTTALMRKVTGNG